MEVLLTAKFLGKLPRGKIGKVRCIMARKIGQGSGAKTINMRNKAKLLQNMMKEDRNRIV